MMSLLPVPLQQAYKMQWQWLQPQKQQFQKTCSFFTLFDSGLTITLTAFALMNDLKCLQLLLYTYQTVTSLLIALSFVSVTLKGSGNSAL